MAIRKLDVTRRVVYNNYKKAMAEQGKEKEIAYDEFDGYEIITTEIFNKGFETYKSFGRCGLEVLEKYTNKIDAVAGHIKWCMKEGLC